MDHIRSFFNVMIGVGQLFYIFFKCQWNNTVEPCNSSGDSKLYGAYQKLAITA